MDDGDTLIYVHLPPQSPLPSLTAQPCKVVLLARQRAQDEWERAVANWLLDQGCYYFMAWGTYGGRWEATVDLTIIETRHSEVLTDQGIILTTSHEGEPLEEVLWYCNSCASHPIWPLRETRIFDIGEIDRRDEVLAAWERSEDEDYELPERSIKAESLLTRLVNRLIKPA